MCKVPIKISSAYERDILHKPGREQGCESQLPVELSSKLYPLRWQPQTFLERSVRIVTQVSRYL